MSHAQSASFPALVVANGQGRLPASLYVVGDRVVVKISSRDTNGAFAVVESVTQPKEGPPLHLHKDQDEWWYVVEGEFLFQVDGEQYTAGPGATVFARRGTRHTFQNVSSTPGRMIISVVPGGLDLFFEELSAQFPAGAELDHDKLAALFAKYGLELLGPPLSAW